MNFTKDQIEFIKDLLRKQRFNCAFMYMGCPVPDEASGIKYIEHSIEYAPEPELPEAMEIDAYGDVDNDMHFTLAIEGRRPNATPVYLRPATIVFPTDKEIIEYANEVKQISEYDKGRWYGRVEGVNYLKSKTETK